MLGQAWQQAGNDSGAILPSLLQTQIWQDYSLARPDGAEAPTEMLMRVGEELGSRVCQPESASVPGAWRAERVRRNPGVAMSARSLPACAGSRTTT
jgi:hypothetical protein